VAADLLLGLGAAVVKVACKIWLRDNSFASDASSDVVDIVKEKLSGELDQRKARRLFEDLEEPVAKKLGYLREHEMARMPDNEWEAAILGVGDTLRRAQFTDEDIFSGDLDPLYLRRKIAAGSARATRDLSEAATEVYGRLLTECCAYVVELTTTLPRFVPGAFAEVLRRETTILQRCAEILDRMPTTEKANADVTREEADFTAAYRRQVVSQLDRLELFGVTVSESVRGYPLSTAYIPLSVNGDSLQRDPAKLGSFTGDFLGDYSSQSLRIDEALTGTSRLFLRGEAGSGKTTLLQWLAVRAARQDFPEQLSSWNDLIPFLVRLRRSVGKELPAPEDFVNEVGRHIAVDMPRDWVHRLLHSGRALLLVDGVDELPESQRRPARDWLTTLLNTFPNASYVITSRPGAAASTWLDAQSFDAAEIQPMGWTDVMEFVRHWHAAFRADSTDADNRDRLTASETTILKALHARRHLRMLAASPLLCALLCALNLDRRAQLPDERMELYAIALDMLLERRDTERLMSSAGDLQLSKTVKSLLLEDLAYWLIRSGWSDAPRDRVADRFARRLMSIPRAGTEDGSTVLDALIVRSGLIREPIAGRIDFVHRTFEEYLAASAAVKDDEVGELVRNAHDDQWREVIVMAAGHVQPRHQREEMLRGILTRAEAEPRKRQLLQTLAVACLETSPQLDQQLHGQIQAIAESLLPPRGIRQAEVLATIGEPLLDLLAQRPARGVRQAAATIRAASLVGGEAALPIITACGHVPSDTVRRELYRAWPLFDPEEYARAVLSETPNMSNTTIDSPSLISGLKHIYHLEALHIDFREGYGDLQFIRDLPEIVTLNIRSDPALHDLAPLAGHRFLKRVMLYKCGQHVDLTPIAALPMLHHISFDARQATNVYAIRECEKIEQIAIRGVDGIDYLMRLLPMHPLRLLDMSYCNCPYYVSDLPDIPALAGLQALNLANTPCSSIRGIDRWAESLSSLGLGGNSGPINLGPLADLPNLEELSLHEDAERDLIALRDIPSLKRIWLNGRARIDLTALQGVKSATIYISRNRIVRGADLLGEGSRLVRQ
jgi:hypothetical protein